MRTKTQINDLGIFNGIPTFQEKLHVGRPNIGNRDRLMDRINDLLDRRWLTNDGPFVHELEQRISELIGVKHCIVMCNGTVALEIAIRALGMTGEVIVPSMTFVATAHALQWQEITPVFCDISPASYNIDPDQIEKMITPRTTGIIGVHLWGRPCDTEAISEIAERRKLKVIYDAAHAFGCSHHGQMIGNFGDAEVYSFHATKFFNTLEGGAVVTNNDELAEKIRLMKNFGFAAGYDNVVSIGTNGKMNEVSAAMGLTSLESMGAFIEVNYQNYQQYHRELAEIPGVQVLPYDESEKNNYQYIILIIDDTITQINRDLVVKTLHAENVLARRYFYPGCHKMEPYNSHFPHAGSLLPITEKLTTQVLSLPNGTAVGEKEIHTICEIIKFVILKGAEISKRFDQTL